MAEIAPKYFGPLNIGERFKNDTNQYYSVVGFPKTEDGHDTVELNLFIKDGYTNVLAPNGKLFMPVTILDGEYYIQTPRYSGYTILKGGKSKTRHYKKYGTKGTK